MAAPADAPANDVVELGDAKSIRALAHPARLVVIDALYDRGLALTATAAAELAGITPSAMSYHLRALERYGIVRRAEPSADGRERPWVRAANDIRIRPGRPGEVGLDRAMSMATTAVLSTAIDVVRDRMLGAIERRVNATSEALPLDGVTQFGTMSVTVTAEEAAELVKTIHAASEPFRTERRTDAPEGAGMLTLVIAAYPELSTTVH